MLGSRATRAVLTAVILAPLAFAVIALIVDGPSGSGRYVAATMLAPSTPGATPAVSPASLTPAPAEEKPKPKDGWDKMQAVSGLVISGVVALFGVIATATMAERSRRTTDDRARETIQISRATALGNLVPHLASPDSRVREAALIAVDSLGHKDLFLRLARAFGGEAAIGAVARTTLAEQDSAGREDEPARIALTDLVEQQASATFVVALPGASMRASGFVTHAPEWLLTTFHVVSDRPLGSTFSVRSSRGQAAVDAELVFVDETEDVAVLRAPVPLGPPLPLADQAELAPGGRVLRTHGDGLVDVGAIQSLTERYADLPGSAKVVTSVRSRAGDSGAPVFNPAGHVVGMVQAGSSAEDLAYTLLIPSFVIARVVRDMPTDG